MPTPCGIGGPLVPMSPGGVLDSSGPAGMGFEQTFFRESPVHFSEANGWHSDFNLMQDRPGLRPVVLEKLDHMPFSGQTTLDTFDPSIR